MPDSKHAFGLQWQPALTNGFLHDGWVWSITHPIGFRDATISVKSPWYWDVEDAPLPDGLTHDQVNDLRLMLRFKDVAEFAISMEGDWWETHDHGRMWAVTDGSRIRTPCRRDSDELDDSGDGHARKYESQLGSPQVMKQTIYLSSEIDREAEKIRAAEDDHGGRFHSARMRLESPCTLTVVFRDCECVPSDWAAYHAWSAYPFDCGVEVPPLRTTPLATAGRYVWQYRRHLCTTRINWGSNRSADEDAQYLCDDCLEEWLEDYAPARSIPLLETGSGDLDDDDCIERSWERGRYPNRECRCHVRRRVP